MASAAEFYPPGPRNVPEDLTVSSSEYKYRAALLLVSLLTFAFVYIALVIGSFYLTFWCCFRLFPLGIIPAIFFGMLFLFLVKGLFKRREVQKSLEVEVTADDHPRLFEFIDRLCEDTGAPRPYRVVLTHEVNAAVFYHDSVLGLFLPGRKNLLIGMGLVNVLNLSEFKAVLAHEFGHFAQSSMKLHQYVYKANHIIANMVCGRDWFDHMVERMRDRRDTFAVVGHALAGMLWLFRKGLEGCFYGINFLSLSLSRQMEFNADLVAVSVTGSDAIVRALSRLDFASQSLDQAFVDLKAAADHDLFTSDLFYHHNHSASYLRKLRQNESLGEPPVADKPGVIVTVFDEDDEGGIPPMWSTHPSNFDRERNAKEEYVHCETDDRSPWILFDDPVDVRERVSWKFYRVIVGLHRDVPLTEAADVQKFIDDEHAETTYDKKYGGLYDGRPINPGKIPALVRAVKNDPLDSEELARKCRRLYNASFRARMKDYLALREEHRVLIGLRNGDLELKGETFKFRGKRYDLDDVKKLLKKVKGELEDQHEHFAELDKAVFRVHFQMCKELDDKLAEEMIKRYTFHMNVQDIDRSVVIHQEMVGFALSMLTGKKQVTQSDVQFVRIVLKEAHKALEAGMDNAHSLRLPRLKNMKEGSRLGSFLLRKELVRKLRPSSSGKWVGKFLQQLNEVEEKIRRIHFKSLGGILALQERVAKEWAKEQSNIVQTELLPDEEDPLVCELEPEEQPKLRANAGVADEDDPGLLPVDDEKPRPAKRVRHNKL